MSSRNTYSALTPQHSVFPIAHSSTVSSSGHDASSAVQHTWEPEETTACSRIDRLRSQVQDVIRENTGLLLVTGSQAFLSMVNVAVKKLNDIDPPVPTLEVSNPSW